METPWPRLSRAVVRDGRQAARNECEARGSAWPATKAHRLSGQAWGRSPGLCADARSRPGAAPSRARRTVAFAGPEPSWLNTYRCGGSSGIACFVDQTRAHRIPVSTAASRRSPQAARSLTRSPGSRLVNPKVCCANFGPRHALPHPHSRLRRESPPDSGGCQSSKSSNAASARSFGE